jgi:succinyl-CoA synthetase beta subunit
VSSDKGGVNIEDNDPNQIKSRSIELPKTINDVPESVYEDVAADLKLNHNEYP